MQVLNTVTMETDYRSSDHTSASVNSGLRLNDEPH